MTMEWETADDWIKWMDHQDAKDLQWQIDSLIGEKTLFEVYKPEDFSEVCSAPIYSRHDLYLL